MYGVMRGGERKREEGWREGRGKRRKTERAGRREGEWKEGKERGTQEIL